MIILTLFVTKNLDFAFFCAAFNKEAPFLLPIFHSFLRPQSFLSRLRSKRFHRLFEHFSWWFIKNVLFSAGKLKEPEYHVKGEF